MKFLIYGANGYTGKLIVEKAIQQKFDFVISIGVVHHTDDPDKTISNLIKHIKPGGKLILWVYSQEGNLFMRYFLEPFRKLFLLNGLERINPKVL